MADIHEGETANQQDAHDDDGNLEQAHLAGIEDRAGDRFIACLRFRRQF